MPLSIAIIAADRLRRRCHAILTHASGLRVLDGSASIAQSRPNVLLLDAVESPLHALGVLPALRQLSPTTGVILIGRNGTPDPVVLEGLRQGTLGHLAQRDLARDLTKAVRMVATGQAWIPRSLSAAILAELQAARLRSPRRSRGHLRLVQGHASPA